MVGLKDRSGKVLWRLLVSSLASLCIACLDCNCKSCSLQCKICPVGTVCWWHPFTPSSYPGPGGRNWQQVYEQVLLKPWNLFQVAVLLPPLSHVCQHLSSSGPDFFISLPLFFISIFSQLVWSRQASQVSVTIWIHADTHTHRIRQPSAAHYCWELGVCCSRCLYCLGCSCPLSANGDDSEVPIQV